MAKSKSNPEFDALILKAHEAGLAAVAAMAPPIPMVVQQHSNPMDDGSPVVQSWFVADGVCGFAGVRVRPATSKFARYLKANWAFRSSYYGGIESSVALFNQSMTKKEAYATAYARVLSDAGYSAYAWSRMD